MEPILLLCALAAALACFIGYSLYAYRGTRWEVKDDYVLRWIDGDIVGRGTYNAETNMWDAYIVPGYDRLVFASVSDMISYLNTAKALPPKPDKRKELLKSIRSLKK